MLLQYLPPGAALWRAQQAAEAQATTDSNAIAAFFGGSLDYGRMH